MILGSLRWIRKSRQAPPAVPSSIPACLLAMLYRYVGIMGKLSRFFREYFYFSTKIFIFRPKFLFLTKMFILRPIFFLFPTITSYFWPNFLCLTKNFLCWPKCLFWTPNFKLPDWEYFGFSCVIWYIVKVNAAIYVGISRWKIASANIMLRCWRGINAMRRWL